LFQGQEDGGVETKRGDSARSAQIVTTTLRSVHRDVASYGRSEGTIMANANHGG
jgi:hypothetical protein